MKFRAVVIVLLVGFLGLSCAKQKIIQPAPRIKRVPAIRVALQENFTQGNLTFQEPYRLASEEAEYILDQSVGELQVSVSENQLIFKSSQRWFSFKNFQKIEFIPIGVSGFRWNGISYSGILTFVKESDVIRVINRLPLPEYLKGVIPHEIPSHSPEYYQAVISQTIAARTYAMYCLQNPVSSQFDIYPDTRDQVYLGNKLNTPQVNKAIQESYGLILQTPDNELKKIQYHSTCGGMLDFYGGTGESRPVFPSAMPDLSDHDNHCLVSPLYRWMYKIAARDILNNLQRMGMLPERDVRRMKENGFQLGLEILSRRSSGRVEKLLIKTDEREFVLSEWQIRQVLGNQKGNPQPSTLFILKASQNEPDVFYMIGAGYGHGRGMCQWGAIGQALQGKSYSEILKFYYPDLILKKAYE